MSGGARRRIGHDITSLLRESLVDKESIPREFKSGCTLRSEWGNRSSSCSQRYNWRRSLLVEGEIETVFYSAFGYRSTLEFENLLWVREKFLVLNYELPSVAGVPGSYKVQHVYTHSGLSIPDEEINIDDHFLLLVNQKVKKDAPVFYDESDVLNNILPQTGNV